MGFDYTPLLPATASPEVRLDGYRLDWHYNWSPPTYSDLQWKFSVDFEWKTLVFHDPTRKPLPKNEEPWEIGIVQNVLYERIFLKYGDSEDPPVEFPEQLLDVRPGGKDSPFANVANPIVPASQKILYSSAGFKIPLPLGEGMPWIKIKIGKIALHIEDSPRTTLRAFKSKKDPNKKDPLLRFEYLSVFKQWIVAVREGSTQQVVVANMPPFTVMMWAKPPDPRDSEGNIELPDPDKVPTDGYVYDGNVKQMRWVPPKANAPLRPSRGPGHPAPITKPDPKAGTANDRADRWLRLIK